MRNTSRRAPGHWRHQGTREGTIQGILSTIHEDAVNADCSGWYIETMQCGATQLQDGIEMVNTKYAWVLFPLIDDWGGIYAFSRFP